MDNWKPIESAPRTRKTILVFCNERKNQYTVSWNEHFNEWVHAGSTYAGLGEAPTHWQPLPEPPKDSDNG